MKPIQTTTITLPVLLNNEQGLYLGNLRHYFRVVFNKARNLKNPYHNFRHLFHVVHSCYQACAWYDTTDTPLTLREKRNLLIAAVFHDFDNSGRAGKDDIEIEKAVRAITKYIAPEDTSELEHIVSLIKATQFPLPKPLENPTLSHLIIRDADMSQTFSIAWIQQIVFGLAEEFNSTPIGVLEMQEKFLPTITFNTEWAKQAFPADVIQSKIEEAKAFLAILKEEESAEQAA
jgi:hypothetical protein